MTNELDLKQIIGLLRSRLRMLLSCSLIGILLAMIINVLSPKIYEAYFELQLGKVMVGGNSDGTKESYWVSVPQSVDARRILMSPVKISQSVVEACGYADTNENRKKLINQIRINALDSVGSEIFVYVRLSGRDAVIRCAEAVRSIEIANSNAELKKYIESASAAGKNSKIIKVVPAISSAEIRVSSDYIYPRIYLNLIAGMFMAIFVGLFAEWLYTRYKNMVGT